MATFELTGPDGSTYQLDAPDEHAALSAFQTLHGSKPEPVSVNNVVRSAAEGVPIVGGLLNKANAATNAALAPVLNPLFDKKNQLSELSFGERYAHSLRDQEGMDKKFQTEHPIVDTAAKVTGGVASLIPAMAAAPAVFGISGTVPQMVARGAASGAALSGADAAVRGEDPIHAAEVGGIVGGAAGPVGRVIGKGVSAIADRVRPAPVVPQNVARVGNTEIPLTESQITASPAASAEEQILLRGGRGDAAQEVAQGHQDLQGARVNQARDEIGAGFDPAGRQIAANPQEAGQAVSAGVADRASKDKELYQQLYKDFGETEGALPRAAFDNVAPAIKSGMESGASPVIVDDVLTPYASRALADVEKSLKPTPSAAASINQAADQKALDEMIAMGIPAEKARASLPSLSASSQGDISLQSIDQARKRLVSFYQQAKSSGSASDMRAVQGVIKGFDDHIEKTIDAGLFSGSERALPTLRAARQQFAYYKNTYGPKGSGDFVGQKMANILGKYDGQASSPDDVANFLYGSSGVNGKTPTIALAQHLKSVLGKHSDEWSAVRQGLWKRLTEPAEGRLDWGPQKISEALHEFLNGKGKELSHVLFTAEERRLMTQLAGIYKQMIPVKGTTNPSGTAPMLAKIASGARHSLLPLLGFSHGGVPGAMVAYGVDKGLGAMANAKAARNATKLFYGGQAKRPINRAFQRGTGLLGQGSLAEQNQ